MREESSRPRHHRHAGTSARAMWRPIAGCRVKDLAQAQLHIAFQLRFGHSRRLEVKLIEAGVIRPRHECGWWGRAARPIRHTQADDGTKAVWSHQRCVPCYRRAPVMAGDDRTASLNASTKATMSSTTAIDNGWRPLRSTSSVWWICFLHFSPLHRRRPVQRRRSMSP